MYKSGILKEKMYGAQASTIELWRKKNPNLDQNLVFALNGLQGSSWEMN